jgi:hypothetical protein
MDLSTYQDTSGVTVPEAKNRLVTANIVKARVMLEGVLGFPLDPDTAKTNLYTETGKTRGDSWSCDDFGVLDPADDEPDAVYRLFSGPHADNLAIQIDPCTQVLGGKLVHGSVTVHTFEATQLSLIAGAGFGRLVNVSGDYPYQYWYRPAYRGCNHLQLAVNAKWIGAQWTEDSSESGLPPELEVVWAELVTWLSDPARNVRSESRGTRSYTKSESKSPLDDSAMKAILARYAGPTGTAGRLPI